MAPFVLSSAPYLCRITQSYRIGQRHFRVQRMVFECGRCDSRLCTVLLPFLPVAASECNAPAPGCECEEDRQGKFNVGISAIVRVTLKDGCYHEVCALALKRRKQSRVLTFVCLFVPSHHFTGHRLWLGQEPRSRCGARKGQKRGGDGRTQTCVAAVRQCFGQLHL